MKLLQTNLIEFNGRSTEFLTEKSLKDFLLKEAIPCLSCRFKSPKDFYSAIIDKIPKTKGIKKFKMIYSHLVKLYPHDYLKKSELAKRHNLKESDIFAEGSVNLMDTSLENKPLVRWLITKK